MEFNPDVPFKAMKPFLGQGFEHFEKALAYYYSGAEYDETIESCIACLRLDKVPLSQMPPEIVEFARETVEIRGNGEEIYFPNLFELSRSMPTSSATSD